MNKKEAIEVCRALWSFKETKYKENEVREALDFAIKALMAYRDCKHCTHNIKVGNMRGCALWDCDFEDARGIEE